MLLNEGFIKIYEELSALNEAWYDSTRKKELILHAYLESEDKEYFLATVEENFNNGVFGKPDALTKKRLQDSLEKLKNKNTHFNIDNSFGWMPLETIPKELLQQSGIYVIKNKLTGQAYIGKASRFKDRVTAHNKATQRDSGALHDAIRGHEKDFEWGVLNIEWDPEVRNSLESAYIGNSRFIDEGYNTLYYIFDYNLVPGGKGGKESKLSFKEQLEILWAIYSAKPFVSADIARDFSIDRAAVVRIADKSYDWVKLLISYMEPGKAGYEEIYRELKKIIKDEEQINKFIRHLRTGETIHPANAEERTQDVKTAKASTSLAMKLIRGMLFDYGIFTGRKADPPEEILYEINKALDRGNKPYFDSEDETTRCSEIYSAIGAPSLFLPRLTIACKSFFKSPMHVLKGIEIIKDSITKYCKTIPKTIEELRRLPGAYDIMKDLLENSGVMTEYRGTIKPTSQVKDSGDLPNIRQLVNKIGLPPEVSLESQLEEAKKAEAEFDWAAALLKGVPGGGHYNTYDIKDLSVLYNFNSILLKVFNLVLEELNK